MHRATSTVALLSLLAACGAPPSPDVQTPTPEPSAPVDAGATEAADASSAEPDAAAPGPPSASTAGLLTREQLESKPSLDGGETPFPDIAAVTKDLGPPAVQGTVKRVEFRYDVKPLGSTFSCQTLDVLRLPSGAAVFDPSVYTAPECKKVQATEKKLREALVALGEEDDDRQGGLSFMLEKTAGKAFDGVVKQLEKSLGKPASEGEVPMAAWRYVDWDERCKLVVVTKHLGSGAGQAIWGTPFE